MKKILTAIISVILCTAMSFVCIAGTQVIKGDMNGDGKITIDDARMVLRTSIGLEKQSYVDAGSSSSTQTIPSTDPLSCFEKLQSGTYQPYSNYNEVYAIYKNNSNRTCQLEITFIFYNNGTKVAEYHDSTSWMAPGQKGIVTGYAYDSDTYKRVDFNSYSVYISELDYDDDYTSKADKITTTLSTSVVAGAFKECRVTVKNNSGENIDNVSSAYIIFYDKNGTFCGYDSAYFGSSMGAYSSIYDDTYLTVPKNCASYEIVTYATTRPY